MSRARQMAVLAACERVIRDWPVAARVAFRAAVFADVSQFASGDWDPVEAQVRAEIFGERWSRGLPWPPAADELTPLEPAAPVIDRAAVDVLVRRIRALGIHLAVASR